jgi:phosphate transport system substrate-binding protein
VKASYETIADGTYKVSRPLFVYAKKQHIGQIPGMAEFIAEYVSDKALGEDGYLSEKGLVTLPGEQADKTRAVAKDMTALKAEDVK